MTIRRVLPDFVTPLGAAASLEEGLTQTLRRLVRLTGAAAGGLVFRPSHGQPVVVTAGTRTAPAMEQWLRSRLMTSGAARTSRRARVTSANGRAAALLRVSLAAPRGADGELALVGSARRIGRHSVPPALRRHFGTAIEQGWQLHRRTLRMTVLNDLTNLVVSGDSVDDIFRGFAGGLGRLVKFDAIMVALIDHERGDAETIDIPAPGTPGAPGTAGEGEITDRGAPGARGTPRGAGLTDGRAPGARGTAREAGISDDRLPAAPGTAGETEITDRGAAGAGGTDRKAEIADGRARGARATAGETEITARGAVGAGGTAREAEIADRGAAGAPGTAGEGEITDGRAPTAGGTAGETEMTVGGAAGARGTASEAEIADIRAPAAPGSAAEERRMPVAGTVLETVVATGMPVRLDDLAAASGTEPRCPGFAARGYRSAVFVPLVSGGGVIGAVGLAATTPAAFTAEDTDVVTGLVRPLASAIQQRRLLDETRRRADELRALYRTSQLLTARLDVASVLDGISRAVTALIGGSGCGIALLADDGRVLQHAAAHGFRITEWRALDIPVGDGMIGRCAAAGEPIRVDDIRTDTRSARRDFDEREGLRSMLCVPLRSGRQTLGVISAFSTRRAAFTAHHQRVLEAFAEQAGIAIANARLYEESERRARETRALLEAGRVVTASLDVAETMSVIMAQARNVLGVASCGIMTLDSDTRELVSVASLDLPSAVVHQVRVREGEGIAGLAVLERRPVQSPDVLADHRVRYPELQAKNGLRSMLAVPLRLGERAIGALIVFRHDVHRFSAAEEELLVAFADQAAIALQHAQLYQRLEGMVADRTRQLDAQKRFVEVVLETLPLGVFVLDAGLGVIRENREAERVLPSEAGLGAPFARFLGDAAAEIVPWLSEARSRRQVSRTECDMTVAGEARVVQVTAVPLEEAGATGRHLVVLVDDITLAKRLEQQLLLTERLTTAGKLASGVAHELNNPLATIAGCAESLLVRLREHGVADRTEFTDFRHYLTLIEEEAYRCKDITGSLLQFVREPGSRRTPADLNALVQKVIELLSHQSRFTRSRFTLALDPALPVVTVNEGQLRQVFLGIAANALEAMDGEGTLTIRTRVVRGELEVEFDDEGPGIPAEVLPRVFDPFFTTKPPGQGTGLGLAIAQGIVADHGGRVEVTSRVGQGSVFRVVLPQ